MWLRAFGLSLALAGTSLFGAIASHAGGSGPAIVFAGRDSSGRNGQIIRVSLDGSQTDLAHGLSAEAGLTISPDKGWVAFLGSRTGAPELYAMHLDGSHVERLTPPLTDQCP